MWKTRSWRVSVSSPWSEKQTRDDGLEHQRKDEKEIWVCLHEKFSCDVWHSPAHSELDGKCEHRLCKLRVSIWIRIVFRDERRERPACETCVSGPRKFEFRQCDVHISHLLCCSMLPRLFLCSAVPHACAVGFPWLEVTNIVNVNKKEVDDVAREQDALLIHDEHAQRVRAQAKWNTKWTVRLRTGDEERWKAQWVEWKEFVKCQSVKRSAMLNFDD